MCELAENRQLLLGTEQHASSQPARSVSDSLSFAGQAERRSKGWWDPGARCCAGRRDRGTCEPALILTPRSKRAKRPAHLSVVGEGGPLR